MLVLFGNDMEDLPNKKYPFIHRDGTVKDECMKKIFLDIINDYVEEYFHPLTALFPFLNKYSLIQPYKRNYQNLIQFKKALKQEMVSSKDINSARYLLS